MAKATSGSNGAFTYDFGIQIAQNTVNRLMRTAQASLTLASAYYALNQQATEYTENLRKNQIYFGGQVSAMRALADAQERIIQGQSRFSVKDQMEGMRSLAAVGIDARKEMEWTEKAAHALGVSYSQFSNAIAQAVRGNMGSLVDMGLITERATRAFAKYQGNTVMMQSAVLNFVKQHKGLQTLIKQDFETVQDQMLRIKAVWKSFLQSIVGRPNDPGSFLGQANLAFKEVAVGFANNAELIRRYGFQIGQVLGWLVRQVGHVVTWLGRQVKNVLQTLWKVGDDYQEAVRSVIVWLEFQKRAVIDFFKEYGDAIKTVIKLLLLFAVAKRALVIGAKVLQPIVGWFGKVAAGAAAATWKTTAFGKVLTGIFSTLPAVVRGALTTIGSLFTALGTVVVNVFRAIGAAFFGSNPVGWVALAVAAVIAGLVVLYKKSEKFRDFVKALVQMFKEEVRMMWNFFIWAYTKIRVAATNAWNWVKNFFANIGSYIQQVGQWFSKMWDKFMDTKVGQWFKRTIIDPIKQIIDKITPFLNWILNGAKGIVNKIGGWFGGAADYFATDAQRTASENGFSVNPWVNNTPATTTESATILAPMLPAGGDATAMAGSSMVLNSGAVQIVLQGSEGIDENVLAQKVRQVLADIQREGNMRGGRA